MDKPQEILDRHLENSDVKHILGKYSITYNACLDAVNEALNIPVVSQRSEPFALEDSREFKEWQQKQQIHRESNDCYRWNNLKYQRQFFLDKYVEDRNKANCG